MFVLSRQHNESLELLIPPSTEARRVTVTVVRIDATRVRIGTDAPLEIEIIRPERSQAARPAA